MPLLIQTGLEKFQFNRSRPISEPVCNQFPSVVSRSPYLSASSSRASCREFMKRTILQKKKRKKTEREGKRTSTRTGDKNRRATCPPPKGDQAGSARRTRQNSKWKRDGSHSRERRKRSTRRRKLPSIVRPWTRSERKNREWDNRVRDARWRGRVEEEEREREGEEKWTKLERGGRWARRCEWIVPVGRSRVPWRAAGLVHGCVSCRAAVHRGTRWDDVYVRRRCG